MRYNSSLLAKEVMRLQMSFSALQQSKTTIFILLQKMNFFYSEEEEVPCHPQPNKEECDMVVLATIISYTLLGLMILKVE